MPLRWCDGEGEVAEAGDEFETSAECFDVTGDRVDGGQLAALDLGYPAGRNPHRLSELSLGQAAALTLFSQPVAALASHQYFTAAFGFLLTADALDIGGAVPLGVAAHRPSSSSARSFR